MTKESRGQDRKRTLSSEGRDLADAHNERLAGEPVQEGPTDATMRGSEVVNSPDGLGTGTTNVDLGIGTDTDRLGSRTGYGDVRTPAYGAGSGRGRGGSGSGSEAGTGSWSGIGPGTTERTGSDAPGSLGLAGKTSGEIGVRTGAVDDGTDIGGIGTAGTGTGTGGIATGGSGIGTSGTAAPETADDAELESR